MVNFCLVSNFPFLKKIVERGEKYWALKELRSSIVEEADPFKSSALNMLVDNLWRAQGGGDASILAILVLLVVSIQ